jgi:hypothetical protein
VQRGGEARRGHQVEAAAVRTKEVQPPVAGEQPVEAGAPAQIEKICAAAEGDVLTVVALLAGGAIDVGAGAAAQPAAGLVERHRIAALDERRSSGQSRQAAADNRHARHSRKAAKEEGTGRAS